MPKKGLHDSGYLDYIQQLVIQNSNFKLIDNETNLFTLLEECHLSISVPYTSTAYVASFLKKPAVYYDPFAELIPKYEDNSFIYFASEYEELKKITNNIIG